MKLSFYPRLILVILLAVALSEFAPEAVNAVLILILAGLFLSHYKAFAVLGQQLGNLKGA
jgi:hypothetical protein